MRPVATLPEQFNKIRTRRIAKKKDEPEGEHDYGS